MNKGSLKVTSRPIPCTKITLGIGGIDFINNPKSIYRCLYHAMSQEG